MIDLIALAGKGFVGVVVVFIAVVVFCALAHLQGLIRRKYPNVDKWGGRVAVVLYVTLIVAVVLLVMGVAVETFFWR
mgnify:CR=1 FL=1